MCYGVYYAKEKAATHVQQGAIVLTLAPQVDMTISDNAISTP